MAVGGELSWGERHPDDALAIPSCNDDNISYRRLKLLGQGSFGKAFLVRDLATNDRCVMKQVRVEKMDRKARDTAVREAVALRRLRHPNVVRFRQVFVRSGWLCLVMDFADGGDLCAAVKERAKSKIAFEENAVLECFSQIADAVGYVHMQKMVHRDIKSRNVFLCRTGKALLGDFGLVRLLESTCELAHTRVGTPYYLSPEIIKKQPYNYKTDIWSLGVLLYEMAALQRPFAGTLESLPKVILKGHYEPLSDNYSQGLKDTVAGLLQVDPAKRVDLQDALRSDILAKPLQRSREALGLEIPPPPEKSVSKRKTEPIPSTAAASEWIGYNTMIRRSSEGPIIKASTTEPATVPTAPGGSGVLSTSIAPANWSMAAQRDPGSDDGDFGSVSSDSWGSVVAGNDMNALQQAVNSTSLEGV